MKMRDMDKMLFSTNGHFGCFILNSHIRRIGIRKKDKPSEKPPDIYRSAPQRSITVLMAIPKKIGGKVVMSGSVVLCVWGCTNVPTKPKPLLEEPRISTYIPI